MGLLVYYISIVATFHWDQLNYISDSSIQTQYRSENLGRQSKTGFLNPKESGNRFCVSLLDRSILHLSDHGASREPKNALPEKCEIHFRILSDLRWLPTVLTMSTPEEG